MSTTSDNLSNELLKYRNNQVVLLDVNDHANLELCSDIIYLFEPSFIKLNRLMMKDRKVFERLRGNKIVLSKSMLSSTDIAELEYEAKTKFFFNIPPLDDRSDNTEILEQLLSKLGIVNYQ